MMAMTELGDMTDLGKLDYIYSAIEDALSDHKYHGIELKKALGLVEILQACLRDNDARNFRVNERDCYIRYIEQDNSRQLNSNNSNSNNSNSNSKGLDGSTKARIAQLSSLFNTIENSGR